MSDKSDDFLSFDKALRELQLRSEELKKLVSEGEIRAYRDGDSMKFRRDDVQSLAAKNEGDTRLSLDDSLEDDTGMVTEQISDEDTLLAEDDVVVETTTRRTAVTRPTRGAALAAATARDDGTPTWVTAIAGLTAVVMLWASLVLLSTAREDDPAASVITSAFAKK